MEKQLYGRETVQQLKANELNIDELKEMTIPELTNIARDALDWRWERSDDNGQTWQVQWQIHYHRQGG